MKKYLFLSLGCTGLLVNTASAAVITVTTENNINPPSGQTSLNQALTQAQEGDIIRFNIPGDGPHFLLTPPGGYPLITKNISIEGYSEPGSVPNTNPILAPNNAQIKIVLDSRNGNVRVMDFDPEASSSGYGDTEAAVLGIYGSVNVKVSGVSILAVPLLPAASPSGDDVGVYAISFARGASGHVNGCWIGVAPDGSTLAAPANGITGFRYRTLNTDPYTMNDNIVIGVSKTSTNAPAEFNVFTGLPAIPIIIEGSGTRISGNFMNVFPSGVRDFNPPLANPDLFTGTFEGNIEIGRSGNNTVIGVDGDGVNDSNERNIFSGVLPNALGGYDHNIEFYGQTPGTNIVIAGNYFGLGVDGVTRFTNGVPALNAAGGSAQFRFGSDLNGVSDSVEGNVVYNNWPPELYSPVGNEGFFDELAAGGILSSRGNTFVNNFPFPKTPAGGVEAFLNPYYAKALADVNAGIVPVLSTNTTLNKLVGSVPIANAEYPVTIVDLYAADPEGITYGQSFGIPELPLGFVQGRSYIASFVEGSAADKNPAPGAFEFDISQVELKGSQLIVTANYQKPAVGTDTPVVLTSPFSDPVEVTFTPGSVESAGLRHIVADTVVINQQQDALGNWEPYVGTLGNSTFLIEGNAFAEGSTDSQRYVVALQPAAGGAMRLGEGFYTDAGQPFRGIINASRQNGNPGRVAGDERPGATNFIVGAEASPHVYPEFQSDNRWNLGYDRLSDGRYGTIQIYGLDPVSLTQTPLTKALDSANGRETTGAAPGNQITRFGGDVVGLDNGNFVSVVEDRSNIRREGNASVATIFAPNGTVVKESFKIADGDQWSNVAPFKGGFAVRTVDTIYFFDNAGTLLGQVNQSTSGAAFSSGRGDGTRLGGHINSPYVFLAGKVTDASVVKVAAWDSRDRSFVALADVSEGAFSGGFDRANLDVDALNRITVAWASQPAGYEQQQVAARIMVLNPAAKTITALTPSFLPFKNAAATGGIRSVGMSVAMTTRQILIAAKGEINLQNNPAAGANSPREINFYVVITHPAPAEDPTTPAGGGGAAPTIAIARTATGATLTWEGTGFQLESTTALGGAWTSVTTTGNSYNVTGPGSTFYRLRK